MSWHVDLEFRVTQIFGVHGKGIQIIHGYDEYLAHLKDTPKKPTYVIGARQHCVRSRSNSSMLTLCVCCVCCVCCPWVGMCRPEWKA